MLLFEKWDQSRLGGSGYRMGRRVIRFCHSLFFLGLRLRDLHFWGGSHIFFFTLMRASRSEGSFEHRKKKESVWSRLMLWKLIFFMVISRLCVFSSSSTLKILLKGFLGQPFWGLGSSVRPWVFGHLEGSGWRDNRQGLCFLFIILFFLGLIDDFSADGLDEVFKLGGFTFFIEVGRSFVWALSLRIPLEGYHCDLRHNSWEMNFFSF